jgi:hypothetical protein
VVAENGGGGTVNANRAVASTWETWRIHKMSGGPGAVHDGDQIALQTFVSGLWLSAINGGGDTVQANGPAANVWEVFIVGSPGH